MFKANAKAQCVHFISFQNTEMVPKLSELWDVVTMKNTVVKLNMKYTQNLFVVTVHTSLVFIFRYYRQTFNLAK
jgi:hypothetical protein